MSNDQTTKQRFHSSAGQSVSEDYLFFACLQVEKLLKAKNEGVIRPNWPELDHFNAGDGSALEDNVTDMLSWYAANYPILKTHLPIDYSRVAEFTEALVPLVNDLSIAFSNHAQSLAEEWPKTGGRDAAQNLRNDLERMFPDNSDKLIRYLDWSLSPEKNEEFQIGDRPPVGRFAPSIRRSGGPSGRGGQSRGGPPSRGGPSRGGGGNRERGPQRQSNDRNRDNRGNGNRGGSQRGGRGEQRKPQVDPAVVEGRLRSEVEAAIQQLGAQGIGEISLRPQNSYNRRLQHNFVSEYEGFTSTSRGDEPDRFVVIVSAKT